MLKITRTPLTVSSVMHVLPNCLIQMSYVKAVEMITSVDDITGKKQDYGTARGISLYL